MMRSDPRQNRGRAPRPTVVRGFEHIQKSWDDAQQRWTARLLPGEVFVTTHDECIVTVLGSCIAACMRDPVTRIGGMNHFLLPSDGGVGVQSKPPDGAAARFGSYAMESLINELLKAGAQRERLQVKLFGGGRILAAATDIGVKNIAFVREFLRLEDLPVVAEDLGDIFPRRIMYFPNTGSVRVKRLPALDVAAIASRETRYLGSLASKPFDDDVELFS